MALLENRLFVSFIIVLITLFLAAVTKKILKIGGRISSNTKTKIDEIILAHIGRPIQIIVLTFGLFFAIRYLDADIAIGTISLFQIFSALWVIAVAFLVARIIKAFFTWYTEELQHRLKKKIDDTLFRFIRKVINFAVYLFALGIVLKQFGIEITPLLAGLGIAGIAVAMALKDTLANLFSALYITIDRPMKIGDFVEIDATTSGYVVDIGWRSTRLRTWDNNYLIIPNAKIAETVLRNYNAPNNEMTISIMCGVSYDSDLSKVEKIVLSVAKNLQKNLSGTVDKHEPSMRYKEFGDNSINFTVYLKVKSKSDRSKTVHEFIKELHKRFNKEKIEIPFPQRDVHLHKK